MKKELLKNADYYMNYLCNELIERSVGSESNRKATDYFKNCIEKYGWEIESQKFDAMDWKYTDAKIICNNHVFELNVGPYSLGIDIEAELDEASSIEELEAKDLTGKIILLHSEIVREQLMPKNFVFYNPEEHQRIIKALEKSGVKAIIAATGLNSALAGGAYPFPFIEDGDFDIPNVYMKDVDGDELLKYLGSKVKLISQSERINGYGYNIIGRKGDINKPKIVITAHIDAKKNSPGAIDNASGVAVLMLLAELLEGIQTKNCIELIAFNGEDYYAVPGQMKYIESKAGDFSDILFNINIDGAAYFEGDSAVSFYNIDENMKNSAIEKMKLFENFSEGVQWVQGDHSIFLQFGIPAIAISSKWFTDNMESQTITHTPKDNLSIVDKEKIVEIALFIKELLV